MVRDVSVSCAELKLVTVRVARPKQRKTAEKPGLGVQGPGPGQGWGAGQASGDEQHGEKGNGVAKLGQRSLG